MPHVSFVSATSAVRTGRARATSDSDVSIASASRGWRSHAVGTGVADAHDCTKGFERGEQAGDSAHGQVDRAPPRRRSARCASDLAQHRERAVDGLDGGRHGQPISSGISALRRVMNARSSSSTASSIGGAWYSASRVFQIAFARCDASRPPSSSHCS